MVDQVEEKLSIYAKNILKSEMGKKLVKVADLAKTLEINPTVLSTKISRGTFSAGFFFKILQTLGTKEVPVPPSSREGSEFFKDL